jgi:CheY-like chemotaxis protein
MRCEPRVLLVTKTLPLAQRLYAWLTAAGYDVAVETSFGAAKIALERRPDLLISEIRLGDYNGLHLASHARSNDLPAIVIGAPDVVLERDARQMGVPYLHDDAGHQDVLLLASWMTGNAARRERDLMPPLPAHADSTLAFRSSRELSPVKVPSTDRGRRLH